LATCQPFTPTTHHNHVLSFLPLLPLLLLTYFPHPLSLDITMIYAPAPLHTIRTLRPDHLLLPTEQIITNFHPDTAPLTNPYSGTFAPTNLPPPHGPSALAGGANPSKSLPERASAHPIRKALVQACIVDASLPITNQFQSASCCLGG